MASLKEVKNRIGSVKSTRQITSAMKMVASAKLHKAQGRIEGMLPYQRKLNEILANFLGTTETFESPYTETRQVARVALVVLSSNGSLCGAYNSNVIRLLEHALQEYASLGQENVLIYPVGKKVEEAVRKMGYVPQGSYQRLAEKPAYVDAFTLADELMAEFAAKRIDRVELIYYHFKSMGTQVLLRENFLPIDLARLSDAAVASSSSATGDTGDAARQSVPSQASAEDGTGGRGYYNDYIVEPSAEQLIAQLLPKVLSQKIFTILLDANASEHAARMLAMQAATDNANELIQDLTKQYNKGRQQAITNELLDIIGGSLK